MVNTTTSKAKRAASALVFVTLLTGFGVGRATAGNVNDSRKVTITVVGHWPCNEDEWLVGRGDFDGRNWDRYRCRVPDGV